MLTPIDAQEAEVLTARMLLQMAECVLKTIWTEGVGI